MAVTKAPVYFAHISTHNEDCRILSEVAEPIYKLTKVVLNASLKCNHQAYLYHIPPIPDPINTLCDANEIHSRVKQRTYACWNTSTSICSCAHKALTLDLYPWQCNNSLV